MLLLRDAVPVHNCLFGCFVALREGGQLADQISQLLLLSRKEELSFLSIFEGADLGLAKG